ncbi:MAG: hypothetical protein ACI4PW_06215 [Alphaproteobacteria bacterium]
MFAAVQVLFDLFRPERLGKERVRHQADLCRGRRTLKQLGNAGVVRKNKEGHRKVPVQKPMAVLKTRQAAR